MNATTPLDNIWHNEAAIPDWAHGHTVFNPDTDNYYLVVRGMVDGMTHDEFRHANRNLAHENGTLKTKLAAWDQWFGSIASRKPNNQDVS